MTPPNSPTATSGSIFASPEARLRALGIELPTPTKPVAAYVPARRAGGCLYISGQLPMEGGKLPAGGTVPGQVGLDEARRQARVCALNALAAARAEVGSLDRIRGVVRVGVFVASDAGFGEQPKVANGASELLVEVFGEAGRHARAAVGCSALPLGAAVEVEVVFELE
jgi:enamine deaminase RidA (YjgF/YER057c/UK114 family)